MTDPIGDGAVFRETDLQPISALQHLMFCERQWALIHLEGQWEENRLTMEGRHLHERADRNETEVRGDVRIARGVALRSLRIGLTGRADVVEFQGLAEDAEDGAVLAGVAGRWRPFPVEYKRGRPKREAWDEVQLCAQALCLEEMLGAAVPEGALFYGQNRRRRGVTFDAGLREQTEALTARLHELTRLGRTPAAAYEKKCDRCSLFTLCQPKTAAAGKSAARYVRRNLRVDPEETDGGEGP